MATSQPVARDFPLQACRDAIQKALGQANVQVGGRVVTSRDQGMDQLRQALQVKNLPQGFQKWLLPVQVSSDTFLYITVAAPGARADTHAHDGDSVRFVASGSIIYDGRELTAGDWLFIPAGQSYSFSAGPVGALLMAPYQC
jgi:uncharacterized RmlC-like cupin family protein